MAAASVLSLSCVQLVKERAKSAQLDLYVRALAAELARKAGVTADECNAALPMLTGIERRLNQLLKTTPASLRMPAGRPELGS